MKKLNGLLAFLLIISAVYACGPGDGVYFANLENGQEVDPSFIVQMGVNGMEIEPAGPIVAGTGHHHIILNSGYIEEGTTIPMDSVHIHFGQGQTETLLTLKPGRHTLTLQFANGFHQSYGKKWSETITVNVRD